MKKNKGSNGVWRILAEELLVMVLVFICFVLLTEHHDFGEAIRHITDVPTLIVLLLIVIPGMLISGCGKDFLAAFSVGSKQYSLMQLKNIAEAVGNFQRYVGLAAVIEIAVQIIIVCNRPSADVTLFSPNLAVITITVVYASILELLIIPIRSNVVRTINEELDFDDEQSDAN